MIALARGLDLAPGLPRGTSAALVGQGILSRAGIQAGGFAGRCEGLKRAVLLALGLVILCRPGG